MLSKEPPHGVSCWPVGDAMDRLEAALRECVLRGWRGFKAEWVREKSLNRQEALEARNRAVGDAWHAKETANESR